jgi:hypothetical protein
MSWKGFWKFLTISYPAHLCIYIYIYISILRRVPVCTHAHNVHNTTISNALQICALEERIQYYKNKSTLQDWLRKLRIANQTDEEMLHDREDDGRIVSETEQANESLPSNRWWSYKILKEYSFTPIHQLIFCSVEHLYFSLWHLSFRYSDHSDRAV